MAGATSIKITGAREMEKLLMELGPNVARRIGQAANKAAANVIADEARRLVPVRTGELQASITVQAEKGNDEREIETVIGVFKPTSGRAHLVEFGTRHSAARPFMRPALDAKAGEALSKMADMLAKGIEREALKLAKA